MYCTVQRNDKIFWWIVRQDFVRQVFVTRLCQKILRQGFVTRFCPIFRVNGHRQMTYVLHSILPTIAMKQYGSSMAMQESLRIATVDQWWFSGGTDPCSTLSWYSSDIAVDQYCFQYYVIKQVHIFWLCRKYITRYASCYFKQANWPNSVVSGRASN